MGAPLFPGTTRPGRWTDDASHHRKGDINHHTVDAADGDRITPATPSTGVSARPAEGS